jgi:NAD-dependent dihydropyrimidine dehydrogenase PreA subunit/DNA-binding Lrp family transcriptional regulator
MAKDVYKKLAERLDNLPGGFPSTQNGVELRILRNLFTPEEAGLSLHLNLMPEEVRVIARRAKISQEEAASRLEKMAKKGLIYRLEYDKKPMKYMAAQYVIGIWEFHVNDLNPGLIKDMNEYIPTLFNLDTWKKAPQLRTVPVGQSISTRLEALTYEKAEELVRAHEKFLVAPCICRREHKMMDKGCKKPEESCLVLGRGVDYYKRNGLGRTIDLKEALEILKRADRAGLVLQSSNAQKIMNICCCCGCCCQVLKTIKRHPRPSSIISSPFLAHAEPESCEGCGICVERCQMEALTLKDDKVVLDLDRCIGCGLCVTTCSTGSLTLTRKPDSGQCYVPRNMFEALYRLARVRRKINPLKGIKMKIQSSGRNLRSSK